ncbi:MAG: beta strand repeat-containing protein, partial [Alphaproteobacteria bacterium]
MATVNGTAGKDFIHRLGDGRIVPAGYNEITGVTTGNDTINGFAGDDIIFGDSGNDVLNGGPGADQLDGGAGNDWASYATAAAGITASLANPAINTGEAAGDTYTSIERLIGSNFNDTLIGDAGDNFLRGGAGADVLNGGGGSDYADYIDSPIGLTVSLADPTANTGIAAGDTYTSIERLRGSNFNDTLIGDAGNNTLRGGLGADVLNGGAGTDTASYADSSVGLTASLADPTVNTGEAAGDTYISIEALRGSDFNDTLIGNSNNNLLQGGPGADVLNGGGGFDFADYNNATTSVTASLANPASNTGEAAGDTYTSIEGLRGSDFNDTLIGDANDNFLRGGPGADVLNGGAGSDFADYISATAGVTASLGDPTINTGEAGGDTYISIEDLRGSNFNDTLIGDTGNNFLRGGLGADVLNGGTGFDWADYRFAATGLTASLADPTINTGEAAGDTYTSIEALRGSDFNDTLIGDGNSNRLRGMLGGDVLNGGSGFDYADYDNATAGVIANLADPTGNTGEAAGDTYISIEGLIGSDLNDILIGDAGGNQLRGGDGADTLFGGGDDDVIFDDTGPSSSMNGQDGNDTLTGGPGNDYMVGGNGDDTIVGGVDGQDSLYGGAGNDYLVAADANNDGVGSVLDGGAGSNQLYALVGRGNDYAVGGELQDTIAT